MDRSARQLSDFRFPKAEKPRYRPDRRFPKYAYLPGSGLPHPVRHPDGHSFGATDEPLAWCRTSPPEQFLWGVDLFNYCYYWEAHEAWEPFWQYVGRTSEDWAFLKAIILLAAAGVKVREGKHGPMRRHLDRAASLLDGLNADIFTSAIGMSPQVLASLARAECSLAGPFRNRSGLNFFLQPTLSNLSTMAQ